MTFIRSPVSKQFQIELRKEQLQNFVYNRIFQNSIYDFDHRIVHFVRDEKEYAEIAKVWGKNQNDELCEDPSCGGCEGCMSRLPPFEDYAPYPRVRNYWHEQTLVVRDRMTDQPRGALFLAYMLYGGDTGSENFFEVRYVLQSLFVVEDHWYFSYGNTLLAATVIILQELVDEIEKLARVDPQRSSLLLRLDMTPPSNDPGCALKFRGGELAARYLEFVEWFVRVRNLRTQFSSIDIMDETEYPDGFREPSFRQMFTKHPIE